MIVLAEFFSARFERLKSKIGIELKILIQTNFRSANLEFAIEVNLCRRQPAESSPKSLNDFAILQILRAKASFCHPGHPITFDGGEPIFNFN